jgi:hypothetical protein
VSLAETLADRRINSLQQFFQSPSGINPGHVESAHALVRNARPPLS